jgi:hypothetical protein
LAPFRWTDGENQSKRFWDQTKISIGLAWRNGRRFGLKIQFLNRSVGSNPTASMDWLIYNQTKIGTYSLVLKNLIRKGCTTEEIAKYIGRTHRFVCTRLMLSSLPPHILDDLDCGRLTVPDVYALAMCLGVIRKPQLIKGYI